MASEISLEEVLLLRAHIDEAISDPDYSVVVSYECHWAEGFGNNFGFLDNF